MRAHSRKRRSSVRIWEAARRGSGWPTIQSCPNPKLCQDDDPDSGCEGERQAHGLRLRKEVASGLAPEARVRAVRFVFGPYYTMAGGISRRDGARPRMWSAALPIRYWPGCRPNPNVRQANEDWNERAPSWCASSSIRTGFGLIGLSSNDAGQQIQFLTTGITVTQVRENIRTVDVVARTSGTESPRPRTKLLNMTLTSSGDGKLVPLSQVGRVEIRRGRPNPQATRSHAPTHHRPGRPRRGGSSRRRCRAEVLKAIQPIVDKLPRWLTGSKREEMPKSP